MDKEEKKSLDSIMNRMSRDRLRTVESVRESFFHTVNEVSMAKGTGPAYDTLVHSFLKILDQEIARLRGAMQ